MRRVLGALVCAVWLSSPTVAWAQEPPNAHMRAAETFQQAQAAFERREYAAAAVTFEQAARFEPHPAPWLDAADAWERANEPARAATDYDRVLALPSTTEKYVAEAKKGLTRIMPRIATLAFEGPSSVTVRVAGGDAIGIPARIRLAPGTYELRAVDARTNLAETQTVTLTAGSERTQSFMVAPPPPPPPPPKVESPPPAPSAPTASYVAFGLAGTALVVTGIFGVKTISDKSSYEDDPTPSGRDAFHRDQTITNVSLGVAGVFAVTGLILRLTNTRLVF